MEVNLPNDDEDVQELKDATIIGTRNLTLHYSCLNCERKLSDVMSPLSRCSNCEVLQVVQSCTSQVGVNILFATENRKIMLKAYTKILLHLLNLLKADYQETDIQETESILLNSSRRMMVFYERKTEVIKDIQLNE